jgi:hypothetical protein
LNGDFPVHLLTLEQLVNEIKVSIFIEQVTESDQLNGSLFHLLSAGWVEQLVNRLCFMAIL